MAPKVFPQKSRGKTDETKETTSSNVNVVPNKTEERPDMPYVTNVNWTIADYRGLFALILSN